MTAKKVSIIIPNWNGRQLLEKHLPKVIAAKKNAKNNILEIIIVDDRSTDDSVKYLEDNFADELRLIRHKENRGFSASVNMGVRMAKGDLVCLLNTDVSPRKDFLESTLHHFRDDKVFAVSLHEEDFGTYPLVKFKNGYIDFKKGPKSTRAQETLWVSGGSGIFDRDKWLELKGMDEELLSPFYWEDIDLGYRAWKRGYILLWEPKAKVKHKHESVINEDNFDKKRINLIKERNELLVNWKNLTSRNMFKKHVRGLVGRLVKHPGYFRVVISTLPRMKRLLSARKIEKKETKVSDEAIFARFSN